MFFKVNEIKKENIEIKEEIIEFSDEELSVEIHGHTYDVENKLSTEVEDIYVSDKIWNFFPNEFQRTNQDIERKEEHSYLVKIPSVLLQKRFESKKQPETSLTPTKRDPESNFTNYSLSSTPNLETHIKTEIKCESFNCNFCSFSSPSYLDLDDHMKEHDKKLRCSECDYSCNTEGWLKLHLTQKHFLDHKCTLSTSSIDQNPILEKDLKTCNESGEEIYKLDTPTQNIYKCFICPYTSQLKSSLDDHIKTHATTLKKSFECKHCSYSTISKHYLELHISSMHNAKPFKCEVCDYNSSCKGHLKDHMRKHTGEKPFKCNECFYSTISKRYLNSHMINKHFEKPFKCNLCSISFVRKCHLKDHVRMHDGKEPYKCSLCPYTTWSKYSRTSHIKYHTHGAKNLKCTICTYNTQGGRSQLEAHMRKHTGEKPFKCTDCSFVCTSKRYLNSHFMQHSQIKPFKCAICSFSCTRKVYLEDHLREHNGEEPYKCSNCSFTSMKRYNFKSHMKKHSCAKN